MSFFPLARNLILILLLAALSAKLSVCVMNKHFQNCSIRRTYSGHNITFPFSVVDRQPSYCGFPGFELACIDNSLIINLSGDDLRYIYKDIKRMTNSFQEKLGQGGYGYVYKGKLRDGQLVAVKLLKNLKGDGEEFINEVASISRTSHVNVVSLLGFCFEGSKRALVYEFMANGSLEKFIFKSNISEANHQLSWETLYNISLGIAQGLEYLHRGCNARIFCNSYTVSMLGARGTAGYIAPELVIRGIGRVSHKSDVYSYGMMVMEMVSGRKNIEVEVDHTSKIYFPHWIHQRLGLQEELGLHGITNGEDEGIAKKMIIISLWCIQIDPRDRPAMTQVMEMLKGSVEALPIPPKPTLSSPSSRFPVATIDNSSLLQFGATSTTL
ncbi:hypothetical protein EUGRSUZ_G02294 [Eucalyptus grandis]|uniref:Uncharacterized protein n=2 Tax=Eucalyptus grandis TaxID=71139 RepID=A0ACC3K600_EUCGR|nr:hypothetical protein EUGRSUZ_G02294 [Eucalyptus grandis]